ncbi:ECF-type sigma factor [Rothia koreensis]|uniref:ECF-type sigma factor n=1 Tax=Rothia koreensis TaxID=592378 RepID=UPI0037C99C29
MLDTAESFFLATASTDRKKEQIREKIARLNDELASLDAPSIEAGRLVASMKEEGLSNKDIARRLELSSSEVSGYLRSVRDSDSGNIDSSNRLSAETVSDTEDE